MNRIAVFMDNRGITTSFDNKGIIKIFSNEFERWEVIKEFKVEEPNLYRLSEVRARFEKISSYLEDCDIIVGQKISGIAYNVFSTNNLVVWECDGRPENFLDFIVMEEEKCIERNNSKKTEADIIKEHIIRVSDRAYRINLKEIQSKFETISSKKVVIPFLENWDYTEAEIICSHIPPWLEGKINTLCLRMNTEQAASNEYKLKIYK
ncbi:MAG: Fe-only nitrogenase accessory AnfO family protein [Clostridiaceae bacterium]